MIRYPYTLEMWYEDNATTDPETGSSIEGAHEWRVVGRCGIHQNGQAREVRGQDGKAFMYAYQINMPHGTLPILFGTPVRAYDRNGVNYFDNKPRSEDAPDAKTLRAYPVKGFDPGSQKNQDVTIWL